MSFNGYKTYVEEGDTVVIFFSVNNMSTFVVKKEKVFQTEYGGLKHNDLLGKKFGSLIHFSKGWAYVLHPTPELWTVTLPHRTQILYSTDISVIVFQLDLKPGSIVCESGTGSGSLSHALIRAISPTGHLFTFDFHQERVLKCREEFAVHGIGHLVTSEHRDVINDGFGLENVADAVFLDLPQPWDVIPSAKKALKLEGGRICSFSPCIEQVQKTCESLKNFGFEDVVTMECLQRPFEVQSIRMPLVESDIPQDKNVSLSEELNESKESSVASDEPGNSEISTSISSSSSSVRRLKRGGKRSWKCPAKAVTTVIMEAVPPLQTVGHTGYLTFATLYSRGELQTNE